MSREEFAVFVSALRTYYPKENVLPNQAAIELWYRQLSDIPCEIAELSLNKWVATNRWSPSIADIRETAFSISQGEKPMWSDGWKEVLSAISLYGMYCEKEALESMSDITRQAVRRLGFKSICTSDNLATDRANFRMIFEQISAREAAECQLPARLQELISGCKSKLLESERRNESEA